MKKLMMILCTILCANILAAQTFTSGGLWYQVIYGSYSVSVTRQISSAISGSVVIPSTVTYNGTTYRVTSIVWGAFSDCSGLTSVTIPNSVTSIGESAFKGCSGLTSVTIPNSVTSIGSSAFSGCSGLTSVTIPNSVTSIGSSPFANCSGLTSINVASGNTRYSSIDGVLYNYVQDTLIQCPGAKTSVTIPNSVTSIGNSAFSGCSGLTSVTIPTGVTSIGEYAFSSCSGLTSVTIPNSVTSIGGGTFYDCSGLTTLNFNAINCQNFSSDEYGNYPFYTSLTTVNIGDSVQRIPANFVKGCSGLTTLNFNAINCQDFDNYNYPFSGTSLTTVNIGDSVQRIPANFVIGCSGLTSVSIPTGVTSIGNMTFWNCSGLTSVSIPNSVTSIGNYAFYVCSGLTSITIGNRVTSIGEYAFSGCNGLTSITIGNRVTSIGDKAFYGCINLSSLISSATVPPTIGNEAFPYPNICTVTVPCGSLEAYTASTCYWSVYFPQRITESSSFELSVSANDEAYGRVEVENHSCESKTLTAIANNGYEFTGWNDGNTENPRTVTVTSDTAFVAIFTEAVTTPIITVTVNDATMGSASYTMDGNTAILTATANEGYRFLTWNDGNMENPRTVTVTSDTTFMAIFTASGSSSLQEVNAREFALYPNPAKSFVTLEFETLEENTLLQILDINGRKVRTLELKAGVETLRIDLGDLPKGVYTIMLGNVTKKLIVE